MTPRTRAAYLKTQHDALVAEIVKLTIDEDASPYGFIAQACDLLARVSRVQKALREEEAGVGLPPPPWAILDPDGDPSCYGVTEGQTWINAAGLKGRCFAGEELFDFRRRMEAKGCRAGQVREVHGSL